MFERRPAEQARERISTARQRISDLSRQLSSDLQAARNFHSPDYTFEGLEKQRRELADTARTKHRQAFEQLQSEVQSDRETVARWAEQKRPRLADDATALQRAQMAWDGVRMRLDAGMSWQALIQGADEPTLLAVQEWGPAWIEAQSYRERQPGQPAAEVDPQALRSAVDARLLEVSTGEARWALQAESEASVAAGGFEPMARHAQALLSGGPTDSLSAALEAHYGAQLAAPSMAGIAADPLSSQMPTPATAASRAPSGTAA